MRLLLHRFSAVGGLLLFAFLCAALLGAQYFGHDTATITVTTTNDTGPGSLRQALANANDGDTIQFDSALNGQTVSLTSGELVIDKNITINGPGSNLLTIARSSGTFRIFHVMPGHTVTIAGLTITNGSSTGGGVFNDHATLTINSCVVANNAAPDQGGGIYSDGSGGSAALTILNSVVRNNSVAPQPGTAVPTGGGIANNATLTIDNSQVTGNVARAYWSSGVYLGNGGGISNNGANAILTITNSVVSNNIAGMPLTGQNTNEGGISNSIAATTEPGTPNKNRSFGPTLMPSGSGYGGGIDNRDGGTQTITGTTFSGNSATWYGGALHGIGTITNCTFSSNLAWSGFGGAIFGNPVVTNCTISGNTAYVGGGGISGIPTITNSTISGNSILISGAGGGGGINGGGIIRHSTISDNTGTPGSGILATAPLELGNTILTTGAGGTNIAVNGGTVTSHGYNMSNDNGSGFLTGPGDQINTNPMLGPLQNNGGPTQTQELLIGSPAINAGDPNFTPPPFYDQRGFGYVRVYNGRIDIGSLEAQPTSTPSPTPTATPTATATIPPTPTPTPTPTPMAISGTIFYCSNPSSPPLPGVTLGLSGDADASTVSNTSGNYQFLSLIAGSTYNVEADMAPLVASPGINTVDVVAVQRHFLQIGLIPPGCRLTAADVNLDASINTSDVIAIQRFALNLFTGTANVGRYQFDPVNRAYAPLTNNMTGQDYNALVLGDVAAPFVH